MITLLIVGTLALFVLALLGWQGRETYAFAESRAASPTAPGCG